MAKEAKELPVTIGGIKITPEIIEELSALVNDYGPEKAKNIIGENCLYIASLQDHEDYRQIDPTFWAIMNILYRLLTSLSNQKEAGE